MLTRYLLSSFVLLFLNVGNALADFNPDLQSFRISNPHEKAFVLVNYNSVKQTVVISNCDTGSADACDNVGPSDFYTLKELQQLAATSNKKFMAGAGAIIAGTATTALYGVLRCVHGASLIDTDRLTKAAKGMLASFGGVAGGAMFSETIQYYVTHIRKYIFGHWDPVKNYHGEKVLHPFVDLDTVGVRNRVVTDPIKEFVEELEAVLREL